jgi:SAM-dependent methyltransferase
MVGIEEENVADQSGANLDLTPAQLLVDHWSLFERERWRGPILDLACGDGHNGVFLATKDLPVICCDISEEALSRAEKLASENRVKVVLWQVDLEAEKGNPLQDDFYGGILAFRYLHRPLIPCIKKALKKGGILLYETFTTDQPKFGKPHNPKFLLEPGELRGWFEDWEIIYDFEGVKEGPERAVAQVVCRKPPGT